MNKLFFTNPATTAFAFTIVFAGIIGSYVPTLYGIIGMIALATWLAELVELISPVTVV